MQARMKNPAMIIPDAMQALLALAKSAEQSGLPSKTLGLVHLRVSQINGCSVCVDMSRLKKPGETEERLLTVVAGGTRHTLVTPNVPRWRSLRPSPG